MQKHQGALLMRGTPNQRMAVAERAIVLREMEVKDTIQPLRGEVIIQDTTAKAAISPAKVISLAKAAIVLASIEQAATSPVRAINPAKAAIVLASIAKALLSLAKVATSPVRVVTPAVPVLPVTTLMPSTA